MLDGSMARAGAPDMGGFNAVADMQAFHSLDNPSDFPLADAVRTVAAETGSSTAWLPRFWNCVRGPGKLTASEFFYYGLYREEYPENALRRFVGRAVQAKIHRACCDPTWFATVNDKLLFDALMHGGGIPSPETLAVFDPEGARVHRHGLSSRHGLIAFLNMPDAYPIFAKPIDGMYSVGALALTDVRNGTVHVRGEGYMPTSEVADYMIKVSRSGYLLQRMLIPSPRTVECFGGSLASIRLLLTMRDTEAEIQSAVIKIPQVDSVADNYWQNGNMLGAIDPRDGRISRAVIGVGPSLRDVIDHPDTGRPLIGMTIDNWEAARNMCIRAAGLLPGLKTQSWEIALTRKGPVVVEVNWGGDLNLHQLAHGRGALSERFCEHLRFNGYTGRLPSA